MIRRTSIDAYNKIKANGLLGRWQFKVYDVLFHHGPLTQNELHQEHFFSTQPRNIQPRVSELEELTVVACVGKRPCRITGNICMVWDVTENLPAPVVKEKKEKPNLAKMDALMNFMLTKINVLEQKVIELQNGGKPQQGSLF
jgi:hypothetical protein